MIISEKSNYTPAPEGMHNAVCVDIVDLGLVDSQWGKKPCIRLVWELPEVLMEDGRPFLVFNRYNPSLNEKANLRKHLQSWRGRPFTSDELKGFDLESIIGKNCQILIQHNHDDGKIYANIVAITKPQKTVKSCGDYVRVKDRTETPKANEPQNVPEMATSDIPF
jgi:hypothetical protein